MHRVGEGIDIGDSAKPRRERLNGINCATGKKQQGVQNSEHGARHQRVLDPHHQQEHHSVKRQRGGHHHQENVEHVLRREGGTQSRQQRSQYGDHNARHDRLQRARNIQSGHQFELGDRRHQITFVHPARLIVDVQHAAADHDRDEHGQRDRSGQQIFHVLDVGIQLNRVERNLLHDARGLDIGIIQRRGQFAEFLLQGRAHEVVGVVHHQRNPRMVLLINAARVFRRNNDGAVQLSGAHVFHRLLVAVVRHRKKRLRIGLHCRQRLAHLHRLRTMVLIDNPEPRLFDLAAECVAQHDKLHQGKDHGDQHQRGRAKELAQLALDNCPHPVHGRIPGRSGITKL